MQPSRDLSTKDVAISQHSSVPTEADMAIPEHIGCINIRTMNELRIGCERMCANDP